MSWIKSTFILILITVSIIFFFEKLTQHILLEYFFPKSSLAISLPDFIKSQPKPFESDNNFELLKLQLNCNLPKIYWDERILFPFYVNDFSCPGLNVENGKRKTIGSELGEHTQTIHFFGGSTIFGAVGGNVDEETIPSLVQLMILKEGRRDIAVINHGFSTVNIAQEINLMKTINIKQGDVIVFYDGGNDIFQGGIRGNHEGTIIGYNRKNIDKIWLYNIKQWLNSNLYLYQLARSLKDKYKYAYIENSNKKISYDEASDFYIDRIVYANDLLKGKGANFFHFFHPTLANYIIANKMSTYRKELISQEFMHEGFIESFVPAAEAYKNKYISFLDTTNDVFAYDISDIFIDHTEEYFFDWIHIVGNGNKIIANTIYEEIYPYLN